MKLFLLILLVWFSTFTGKDCQSTNTETFNSNNSQQKQSIQTSDWKNANYQGLEIGKSTEKDMFKVLGKPIWSGTPEGMDKRDPYAEIWHDYELRNGIIGRLTVAVKSKGKVIREILLQPQKLSKDEAIKLFGSNYVITKYSQESCPSNDEEPNYQLYESENGQIVQIEYRSKGIALGLGNKDEVTDIFYVSKPFGGKKPECSNSTN